MARTMFQKLLIANRGEVAVRILRAAQDLGIATVAVFSRDDAGALHTQLADTAVALGATGPAAYLDGARLIAARACVELAEARYYASDLARARAAAEDAMVRLTALLEGEAASGQGAGGEALSEQVASLHEELENSRDQAARLTHQLSQAQQDLEDGLAAAREERGNAIASLGTQHQAEIDEREQEHRITVDGLQKELAEALQHAQNDRERMAQLLAETEENARLQIAELTRTLANTEDSARNEVARLTHNAATAEAHARAEIERLHLAGLVTPARQHHDRYAFIAAADHAQEVVALKKLLDESRHTYQNAPAEEAKAAFGTHASANVPAVENAAWVATARIILNLDELITRE